MVTPLVRLPPVETDRPTADAKDEPSSAPAPSINIPKNVTRPLKGKGSFATRRSL